MTSNIPDSYRAGVELTTGWKISDLLRWDGNLALSRNKILNFTEKDVDVYDENWEWQDTQDNYLGTTDISYSPNVVANSIFTFNYKSFEAGLYSSYVGKQYFDNTSNDARSIDAYFVNNLSVGYTLPVNRDLKAVKFKFLINNLFNEEYETNAFTWYSCYVDGERHNESRYFPQARTNFMAAVTVLF